MIDISGTGMKRNEMTISVVIPAYNAEQTIERSIKSVLAQTRPADEIIVIDDGSSDNTAECVHLMGDKVILIQQHNNGVSIARNTGIEAATSEWIAFLDADDEWMESYLQEQTNLLQRNPDLVWSSANFVMCYCDENRCNEKLSAEKGRELLKGRDCFEDYFKAFISGAAGWTGTIIVNKQALKGAGFFVEGQPIAEDLDLWWKIAYSYPRIGYIPKPLAVYHFQTKDSLTKIHTDPQIISDLVGTHLEIAGRQHQLERFKPCAVYTLKYWIHKYLLDNRIDSVYGMVRRFRDILPFWYRICLTALTRHPRVTIKLLPVLRQINRFLRVKI